jgi:hypothetical protein
VESIATIVPRTLALAALVLALQLLAGRLAAAVLGLVAPRGGGPARRRRQARLTAVRALRRAVWPAAAAGALGAAALAALDGRLALGRSWPTAGPFLALGAAATCGTWLMAAAGVGEAAGRLRPSRRLARRAGALVFLGGFGQLVVVWSDLIFRPAFRRSVLLEAPAGGLLLIAGVLALGLGAFAALVAGLAGKPRSTAPVVAALYLLAQLALLGAAQLARAAGGSAGPTETAQSRWAAPLPARLGSFTFLPAQARGPRHGRDA